MPQQPNPTIKRHPYAEFYREPMLRSMNLRNEEKEIVAPRCVASPHQYAELHVTSNYNFLRGASHPDELVEQAAKLGHSAIAITDRNSLAGIVRAHVAAKELSVPLVVGCHLVFQGAGTEARRHEGTEWNEVSHTLDESTPSCLRASVPSCLSILTYPTDI